MACEYYIEEVNTFESKTISTRRMINASKRYRCSNPEAIEWKPEKRPVTIGSVPCAGDIDKCVIPGGFPSG
jgi:hypothetical protein